MDESMDLLEIKRNLITITHAVDGRLPIDVLAKMFKIERSALLDFLSSCHEEYGVEFDGNHVYVRSHQLSSLVDALEKQFAGRRG